MDWKRPGVKFGERRVWVSSQQEPTTGLYHPMLAFIVGIWVTALYQEAHTGRKSQHSETKQDETI